MSERSGKQQVSSKESALVDRLMHAPFATSAMRREAAETIARLMVERDDAKADYVRVHRDFTPETRVAPTPHHVRWDFLGWLCSVCGGWNDGSSRGCRWPHEHAPKASE